MADQEDVGQQEILQAALRLYRKSGPTKVTMDNVAKATKRSRSSLYYYFKNRDEIFEAVHAQIAADVADEIRLAVAKAATLNEKIFAFCSAKIKTTQEWKSVFHSIDKLINADEKSKQMKFLDALHQKLIYLERGILVEALSVEGLFPARTLTNIELDLLAFIISSSVRGMRREIYDHGDPHDPKAAMKLFSELVTKWAQS